MKKEDRTLEGVRLEFQIQLLDVLLMVADEGVVTVEQLENIKTNLHERHQHLVESNQEHN